METYHLTIQLPPEYQDNLSELKSKLSEYTKFNDYILATEIGKGKEHIHLAFTSDKRMDNIRRKIKTLFSFSVKDYPSCMKFKRHNNWSILVAYVTKEGNYETNMLKEDILKHQQYAKKQKEVIDNKKMKYYNIDEIAIQFAKYYVTYRETDYDNRNDGTVIHDFMKSIKQHVRFSTYTKINHEKLIEYAKFMYEPEKRGDWKLL